MYSNYNITQLPMEMIWSIMGWCDFNSSKALAIMCNFDIQISYKYHLYLPALGSNFELFEHLKSFCLDSTNFRSLLMNDQFVRYFSPDQLLIFAAGMGDIISFMKYYSFCDPSTDNNLACRLASSYGHSEILNILLNDHRVDPSAQENYSLKSASQGGYTDVVYMLLKDLRVDPSASDNYAIGVASILGHVEIVKALLQHERLVLPNEFWAIRYAFMKGNTVIVDLLCTHLGLDINLWK